MESETRWGLERLLKANKGKNSAHNRHFFNGAVQNNREAGIARVLDRRTRDRKAASSNPGRNAGRIFFSGVNFVCWLLFDVRSTPV